MRIIIAALALLLALPAHGGAGEGPNFRDRPTVGQQLRFTDLRGHSFRPRALYIVARSGTSVARLPEAINNASSEDHLDLSGTPLVGQLFRDRISPSDAAREGQPVGPVYRLGDALVLDARETATPIDTGDLVLTATLPRDGTVRYPLGRLDFRPGTLPGGTGTAAGTAYMLHGMLVLAAEGRSPLITDWSKAFRGGN